MKKNLNCFENVKRYTAFIIAFFMRGSVLIHNIFLKIADKNRVSQDCLMLPAAAQNLIESPAPRDFYAAPVKIQRSILR